MQLKWATVAWKICQKLSSDIIKKSHPNYVIKYQKAIAGEKVKCPMEGNCQVNNVVHKWDVTRSLPKKVYLGLQRKNGRAVSLTTSYHLNTREIPTSQCFQVTCGI